MIKILLLYILYNTSKSQVHSLNQSNFDSFINTNKNVFVKFYAPWCSYCQKLNPIFDLLEKQFSNKELKFAEVNGDNNPEIILKIKLQGYPVLILFSEGQQFYYTEERTVKQMSNWLQRKITPDVQEISTLSELKSKLKQKANLLYICPTNDKEFIKKMLEQFTKNLDYVDFIYSDNSSLKDSLNISMNYGLVYVKVKLKSRKIIQSENIFDQKQIMDFLEDSRFVLIKEFNDEFIEYFFKQNNKMMIYFTNRKNEPEFKIFKNFAKKNEGKIHFVYITKDSPEAKEFFSLFQMDKYQLPQVRFLNFYDGNLEKYFIEKIDIDFMQEKFNLFKQEELEPFYLSEEIPEQQGIVHKIVSDQVEDYILKRDRNIFLLIHAPFCEHCKKLLPVFESLAKDLSYNKDLVFATYDITKNEHPEILYEGYPTLRLYKRYTGETHNFSNDRTKEKMKEFLEIKLGIKLGAISADL